MGVYSQPLMSAMDTCLLIAWHPVLRRQEFKSVHLRERENQHSARNENVGTDMFVVVMKKL